jgi:cysteine desulfurase
MEKRFVYADNAATTPVSKAVLDEMMPYFTEKFGNASSIYALGRNAQRDLEQARERVAKTIGASASEIYFTSGGTEANNWAIDGLAHANKQKGKHIITSKIEHMAVINSCKQLEEEGYEVSYIDVDSNGIIKLNELEKNIREDTILISVMFANNEIGTIQPIEKISKLAHEKGVLFHVDAVQAIRKFKNRCEKIRYRFIIYVSTQILWTKRSWSFICKK